MGTSHSTDLVDRVRGCVKVEPRASPQPTCPTLWSQVILGGGRKYMFPEKTPDPEYPRNSRQKGVRKDKRNLVQEWQDKHQVMGAHRRGGYSGAGPGVSGYGLRPGSAPPREPGMCGTAQRSFRRPMTPV